jgi:hypothetical protein
MVVAQPIGLTGQRQDTLHQPKVSLVAGQTTTS